MNVRFGILVTLLMALSGCGRPVTQQSLRSRLSGDSCMDQGVSHAEGSTWQASDGCNHAYCKNGSVIQTEIYCRK